MDFNWTEIFEKYDHLVGRDFKEKDTGTTYNFFGIVWGKDDFYYGLYNNNGLGLYLLSCVGPLELVFELRPL